MEKNNSPAIAEKMIRFILPVSPLHKSSSPFALTSVHLAANSCRSPGVVSPIRGMTLPLA